jgi:hypothetical protein
MKFAITGITLLLLRCTFLSLVIRLKKVHLSEVELSYNYKYICVLALNFTLLLC